MAHSADQRIWAEGFRQGYAGFVIRQAGHDHAFAIGYAAGKQLRQVHLQDYERGLERGLAEQAAPKALPCRRRLKIEPSGVRTISWTTWKVVHVFIRGPASSCTAHLRDGGKEALITTHRRARLMPPSPPISPTIDHA